MRPERLDDLTTSTTPERAQTVRTKKDTVNAALAQVVGLGARRQFRDDARGGGLVDPIDERLADQAWRR